MYNPAALVLSFLCLIYVLTTSRRTQQIPPKGLKAQMLSRHFIFMVLLIVSILFTAAPTGSVYLMKQPGPGRGILLSVLLDAAFSGIRVHLPVRIVRCSV